MEHHRMTQVEELFVIDSKGEADQIMGQAEMLDGLHHSSGTDEEVSVAAEPGGGGQEVGSRRRRRRSGHRRPGGREDDGGCPDWSALESELDGMDLGVSRLGPAYRSLFEKVKRLDDGELESVASLELWNLYKEMGPSVWPSFLRYENPPKHVKIFESRFYLSEKPGRVGPTEVVFARVGDGSGVLDERGFHGGGYLLHINQVLMELSRRKGFHSVVFNSEENARNGLINLYLVTNGIKKSLSSGKCQFCGSSRCSRRAKSCKANRCFRCLLKGHQVRDCDTKYGYFNHKLLLPIRIERESVFSDTSTLENLFRVSKRGFDSQASSSKVCICLSCNQTGHINCGDHPPLFSAESRTREDVISSSEGRFLMFPEDPASPGQGNSRGGAAAHGKTNNIISPSNKLFNISYLLEFTKSVLDQDCWTAAAARRDRDLPVPVPVAKSRGGFGQAVNASPDNAYYPQQAHTDFRLPGLLNFHGHHLSVQVPYAYSSSSSSFQSYCSAPPPAAAAAPPPPPPHHHYPYVHPFQTQDMHQGHINRYPVQLQGQPYHYARPVSYQVTTYSTSSQNNTVYPRHASRTVTHGDSSQSSRRVLSGGFLHPRSRHG